MEGLELPVNTACFYVKRSGGNMRAFECKQDERYQFVQKKNSRNDCSRIKMQKRNQLSAQLHKQESIPFFMEKW